MSATALKPAAKVNLPYTIPPDKLKMRGAELPEITSVTMKELFPDMPPSLPLDRASIRAATIEAMNKMDLSKIKPGDTVNLETDLIGKYVEKLLRPTADSAPRNSSISLEFLTENGF